MNENDQPISKIQPAHAAIPKLEAILKLRGLRPELEIKSLPTLNATLWGIHKGKMTLIAARPSIGKSALTIQIAYDLAKQGHKVLFLSLEMTTEDILERIFCSEHKIENISLLRGGFTQYTQQFNLFKDKISRLPLSISDCIGKTWNEIDSAINSFSIKPDVIFIDHLNAIKVARNAKMEIDDYILNLYTIAKRQHIALVICCQINRDNQKDNDKTPQIHELKGSGNLEEMADIIIMLHWPYKYAKENQNIPINDYLIIVGKNRNGKTGYIKVHFTPEHYLYKDKETQTKQEKWAIEND